MESRVERRKHPRYRMQEGVFALLGPVSSKMGKIIDVSAGGIAFQYKKNKEAKSLEVSELSILFDDENSNTSYGPYKFSVEIVSETKLEGDTPFSSASTFRCGIQFRDLTYYQRVWIDDCIGNFSAE